MNNYITDGQRKRINNIDNFLREYHEIDIPDYIIHKLNRKFKSTKYCTFLRTEEIHIGMLIRYIDLDMKKISIIGMVVNIHNNINKNDVFVLYSSSKAIYWKINPNKYYIFGVGDRNNNAIRKFAERNNLNKN